jgi:hypothetical protein
VNGDLIPETPPAAVRATATKPRTGITQRMTAWLFQIVYEGKPGQWYRLPEPVGADAPGKVKKLAEKFQVGTFEAKAPFVDGERTLYARLVPERIK